MSLLAGRLDRRVRIESAAAGDDGYNETETWAPLATVWAHVIPTAGREAREQLGREAMLSSSFRIRYSPRVAAVKADGFRLRYPATDDGQVWDIKSVVEIGRREGLEIIAVARQGAAA